jgi:hypothetical protein
MTFIYISKMFWRAERTLAVAGNKLRILYELPLCRPETQIFGEIMRHQKNKEVLVRGQPEHPSKEYPELRIFLKESFVILEVSHQEFSASGSFQLLT